MSSSTYGTSEKNIKMLARKLEGKRPLGRLGVNGRKILKYID
jgi:hypothetical protein